MFTKMAVILALMATLNSAPVENHTVYIRTMEVIQLNYEMNIVTCVDSEGFLWEFNDCKDYCEHDLVSCLMDTMGTEDSIFDDVILDHFYSGYWVE